MACYDTLPDKYAQHHSTDNGKTIPKVRRRCVAIQTVQAWRVTGWTACMRARQPVAWVEEPHSDPKRYPMDEMRGAAAWNLTCGGPVTRGWGANLRQHMCMPLTQPMSYSRLVTSLGPGLLHADRHFKMCISAVMKENLMPVRLFQYMHSESRLPINLRRCLSC